MIQTPVRRGTWALAPGARLGYDNADGKRQTLGGGATGGGAAVPIFEPVIEAA
jgi:hypothetical protein